MSEKVTAIDGKEYDKSECRKIKGQYWKIGDISVENSGHCYHINDKYYKYNTGYIVYDHRLKQYVIKNTMVLIENGVIGLDENDEIILGSFSKDPKVKHDTYLFKDGVKYIVIDPSVLEGSFNYKECIGDGNFYKRNQLPTEKFFIPSHCDNNYKNNLDYDSRKSLSHYISIYDELNDSKINNNVKNYGSFIKDFTYGIEFETTLGFIPERISDKLGLIPLRDGSIQGLEYATIPLKGQKGLQTVIDICREMKKRTRYNDSCALHIHMGGIPRTEEFFLALFKVLMAIEDEFYSMFPIYMKYNYGIKRKHYTKKFPINETLMLMDPVITSDNIKRNFSILFKFLSSNQSYDRYGFDLKNVEYHPSDPKGDSKWNIKSRYYWCNLIPLLFGNKKTVEFRVHTATLEENKILNYLIICSSILDYVKNNTTALLTKPNIYTGMNIRDIIFNANQNQSSLFFDSIYDYMQQRKDYVYRCVKNGDIKADEDKFNPYYLIHWDNKKEASLPSFKRRGRSPYFNTLAASTPPPHPIFSDSEIDAILNNTTTANF